MMTLKKILLHYERTTPKNLTMVRKVRNTTQGDINFKKK